MSILNFPTTPYVGQEHTVGTNKWVWNGTAWLKTPTPDKTFGIITATNVVVTTTTNAVSTNSGALIVYGGVGIGGDLWLGGDLYAQGQLVLTTATFASGILAGDDIDITIEPGSGAVVISNTSTLQTVTTRGSTTTNAVTFANLTESTSTTTGGVLILGGLGLGGNLALNGKIYANGSTGTEGQVLTTTPTGVVWDYPTSVFDGGTISQPLHIANTTSSTSTTTGALVVDGGVGIGGDVWVAGRVNSESLKIADTVFDSTSMYIDSLAPTAIDTFSFNQFRSAKYMVQVAEGTTATDRCQVTELMLLVTNTGTVNILEYGNIFPNGDLGNFDVSYIDTGTDKVVTLLFLAADTIPKTVKVLRTAMAV